MRAVSLGTHPTPHGGVRRTEKNTNAQIQYFKKAKRQPIYWELRIRKKIQRNNSGGGQRFATIAGA